MDIFYWKERAYDAEERLEEAAAALAEIVNGDPAGGTFSGSQCVEIAQKALAKLEE